MCVAVLSAPVGQPPHLPQAFHERQDEQARRQDDEKCAQDLLALCLFVGKVDLLKVVVIVDVKTAVVAVAVVVIVGVFSVVVFGRLDAMARASGRCQTRQRLCATSPLADRLIGWLVRLSSSVDWLMDVTSPMVDSLFGGWFDD